jgi:two-component system cell cycle response regulator
VRLMAPMLRLAGRLGLGRGEFVSLCERVGRDWAEWGKLLQIRTEDAPRFVEVGNAAAEAAGEPARVAAEGDGPQPMRALVVAGARDDRELLRKEFEAAGVAAFVTAGADAALEAALDIQPQLVVADWSDEGERVVRGLRDMRLGRGVYVICMLDDEGEASLLAASSAGVDDFLVRPLQRAALTVRLRACLRMLVLQQELEHEREELRNFAAELSISNRRLQEAALTDPLTGLPNRRQAIEAMQAEWATATRHNRAFSVMIVDLDGFKAINDTHGHDVGDMALRQAAETQRAALRTQDLICRTGGDEFLVLCPDTDLKAAMLVAERLRVAVQARPVETGGPQIFLTASLGVAMRVPGMDNVDALIKCADDGVYRAKQRGRNCIAALQLESGAA